MFVTGPNVVKTVTHEDITSEALGGAETHASISGVTHFKVANEVECIQGIRKLMSYIPQNCEDTPIDYEFNVGDETRKELSAIIPANANQPYDMHDVINGIIDADSFFEVHKDWAENIICGFSRIGGKSIGIVANQPSSLAGVLDINSSRKAASFVRFCDAFNIPLLTLVDVPGFLPGKDQEWQGIITNGAKLLYAFSEATVPKITVITRKAYGGAYDVMNSKHIGADMNYAWPTAEIAVLGAKPAAKVLFKNLEQSEVDAKIDEYQKKFLNPYRAAEFGHIDAIIKPNETRDIIIKNLLFLEEKKSKI
jgi:propionyl-CoA carboxylase beta chain